MSWFFSEAIIEMFQEAALWLKIPMIIITYFGDAIIYILLVAIAYWIYNKREAIIAIYVLLTSTFLNFFLKVLIQKPRPAQSLRILEESGFSTPSGHAQGSSTFYGWILLHFKKIWMAFVLPILVFLICISRVFLGVHFIGDVILGFIIGVTILITLYSIIPPLTKKLESLKVYQQIIIGEGFALVVFLVTFLLGFFANWPAGDEANSAQIVAALFLFPFIIWIENKYIKMKNENLHWSSILLRIIVGLAVVVGTFFGFDALFDLISVTNYGIEYLLDFIKYSIVILVIGLLMPYIFSKITFFTKVKEIKEELVKTEAAQG